jgi:hypothetical protein
VSCCYRNSEESLPGAYQGTIIDFKKAKKEEKDSSDEYSLLYKDSYVEITVRSTLPDWPYTYRTRFFKTIDDCEKHRSKFKKEVNYSEGEPTGFCKYK